MKYTETALRKIREREEADRRRRFPLLTVKIKGAAERIEKGAAKWIEKRPAGASLSVPHYPRHESNHAADLGVRSYSEVIYDRAALDALPIIEDQHYDPLFDGWGSLDREQIPDVAHDARGGGTLRSVGGSQRDVIRSPNGRR